ncbi:hypothetical protein LTR53_006176 [Teratosphaeriaceae sp. CCFEE 6253]|nr:hypothetical protein LTR53_006176 [Teratosphaeriaceae sp. CCFEE 6253]
MDLPSLLAFLAQLAHLTSTSTLWYQPKSDSMIVPDLTGLKTATIPAQGATESAVNATEVVRKAKSFGSRAGARLHANNGTRRTTQAEKASAEGLQDRQSCASGSAFYACANGFRGCCSVDPCNPGETCPDGQGSSSAATSAAATTAATTSSNATPASSTKTSSTSQHKTSTTSAAAPKSSSTHKTSSLLTASPTGSTTSSVGASSSSSGSIAKPAPACPAANNTRYTDSSHIKYTVYCNSDNSYASSSTIDVSLGGYGECFSACSQSSECAGFTFVGLTSGSCYLKQKMPKGNYAKKDGDNYISCSKVNATAAALPSPSSPAAATSIPHKSNTGAIAGGIIGGIAFLALLLLLVAFLAKRRREKIEERRATVTYVHQGPVEVQETPRSGGSHQRSGSTAHDAFAPFGGFYRGFSSAVADPRVDDEGEAAKNVGNLTPSAPPTGYSAEKGDLFLLPATVYKRPGNPSADTMPMLDGTPLKRPLSQSSGSRTPRFHEHLAEMEDTSPQTPRKAVPSLRSPRTPDTDSPTIGRDSNISIRGDGPSFADEIRRRQHLMSWNTYDPRQGSDPAENGEMSATIAPRTPPAARSPQQVSPDMSNLPRDSSFVVSPFGSLECGAAPPR